MSNKKCPTCGLVNFGDADLCQRCKASLDGDAVPHAPLAGATQPAHETHEPSLLSTIKNDRTALIGAIFPPVAWASYIFSSITGVGFSRRGVVDVDTSNPTFLLIAIGMTLFGVALLAWRLRTIKKTFANCETVLGTITGIAFFRDRGRVDYAYDLNGKTHTCGNAIMKNRKTRELQVGDIVDVLVDSSNPNKAFLKDLYT